MKTINVIINEQHSLLEDQESALNERFGAITINKILIPAGGLTLQEMKTLARSLGGSRLGLVFASPVPGLMSLLRARKKWYVLHNDRREKKELPNGKIIMTIAQEGWEVV